MELRHLRYFVAVAEAGSLTRAAERLGIQQPPLSQQIKALETELGVQLFRRQNKRLEINENGRAFLERARRILADAQEAVTFVRRLNQGKNGTLQIGFTSSASLHPLTPRLIQTFHAQYPHARIQVEESETYALVLALKQRRIDAAFMHVSADRYEDLESFIMAEESVVAAIPAAHALAQSFHGDLPLEALNGERFIAYRRHDGPGIIDELFTQMSDRCVQVNIVREVSRLVAAINLVAAGEGLTLVPETMRNLHPQAVTYRTLASGALRPLPLYLVTRRTERLPILANFIEIVMGSTLATGSDSG